MVLESNRDLVLRRLVECLGRDRTRHQVAEVTSLGLVQMTRKRIGTGLLEAFSENCDHCHGRGLILHARAGGARRKQQDEEPRRGRRGRTRGRRATDGRQRLRWRQRGDGKPASPSPKDIAAMARHEPSRPTSSRERRAAAEARTQPTRRDAGAERRPTRRRHAQKPDDEQAAAETPQGELAGGRRRRRRRSRPSSPRGSRRSRPGRARPGRVTGRDSGRAAAVPPGLAGDRSRRRVARRRGPPAGAASAGAGRDRSRRTDGRSGPGRRRRRVRDASRRATTADAAETVHVPDQEEGLAQALSAESGRVTVVLTRRGPVRKLDLRRRRARRLRTAPPSPLR